ncbi:MAG: murein biosynthesis integral membrane protein MurJ [Synergistaceae bacterium]|nr:murein biosynthesis integral membrane protein MurJ [Synergistaceae bacterium]
MAKSTSTMVRHALFMMAGTLASRVLGLVREIVTAAWFGASGVLDAFNVAFTLANLARQLLAEGALSASFVPVFTRVLGDRGLREAENLARQAFTVLLAATGIALAAGVSLSPLLVGIMAPGFDPVKAQLAVSLTKWMFPFLMFVSLAALAMGVLNSMGSFLVPALAPALSNLVYIIIVLFLASTWGVWGLVLAVLTGGLCQFALQWGWTGRLGITLLPGRPDFGNPDLRKMLSLFLPYAAGLSLNQVNPVISRMLASFLHEGSISVLNYANRIIQLPLGLFVIAVSQAVLPQLSRCPYDRVDEFRETMAESLRFALFIVLPVTLGMMLLSREIVHLLFYRGAFGDWAWEGTSVSLAMYSAGLPGMACSTVVMRGLYARSLPREALRVTLTSVAATALFSLALMKPLGFGGLALATSLSFSLSGWVGIRLLSANLGLRLGAVSLSWALKMGVSLLATAAGALLYNWLWSYPAEVGLLFRSAWISGIFLASCAIYGSATAALRFQEWRWLRDAFFRKKRRSEQ